ncbi:ChaN family lipoprotein [Arenicella xantha]|nr:ChaN family lipoprotein [Arenicella xantha]
MRRWLHVPTAALLFGCVCVSISLSSTAFSQSSIPPVDKQFAQLAASHRILLFGELHGTQEMPAYFAALVSQLARRDQVIKVGIEHPLDQAGDLNGYLQSAGSSKDQQLLLGNGYWNATHQDGRTSYAMFTLVEQLRVLKSEGYDVELFAFDDQQAENRDKALAANISRVYQNNPEALHLVITGNIHSRFKRGAPWNPDFLPMGFFLRESVGASLVTSVEFSHDGGNAWLCTPECKVTELAKPKTPTERFTLRKKAPSYHHDFALNVGTIEVSLPTLERRD